MVSSIDITKPIYGTPTTQSVRDNFHIARDEITALQDTSSGFVNRSGDKMTGMLTLVGPPVNQNDAATLDWTLRQLHSSVNTLIFIGDYDGANDIILSSGQPQFVVGQPLPAASPLTTQYYFVVKTSHAAPGIGNQPAEGVTQGTFLISNGVGWINFAMTAAEVIAQTVPVAPPIPSVPGSNVYDALASIGQNALFKAGGTMTGDLILNRNPVVPMGAATKQFVESLIGGSPNEAPQDGFGYVRLNAAWSNAPAFSRIKVDQNAYGHITLNSTSASNSANQITGTKDNLSRWTLELGGNLGHFNIFRYNDAGGLLDGTPVFSINRANGNTILGHHFVLDPLVSTTAWIFGRGPNNPTDGTSDTLNIYARNGISSSVIGIRGPTYPAAPNGVQIYSGSTPQKQWTFAQDGVLYMPGSLNIADGFSVSIGGSWISRGGGYLMINANADWRCYFNDVNGFWTWDGYPNYAPKFQIDNVGNIWSGGQLSVGGNGIAYRGFSNNVHAFGWNGNLNCYVNGTYVGDVAWQAWVNGNFFTAGNSDSRYLFKWGDTCTGALTVNGRLRTGDALMIASGVIYVADNPAYYLARNTGNGNWYFVENNTVNLTIQPGGDLYARGSLYGGSPWGTLGLYRGGLGIIQQFAGDWYWEWDSNNGNIQWIAGAARQFWINRATDWVAYNNMGPVGGHGWMELSDTRTKTNVTLMEDIGLKELMHINPIRFNRIRNEGGKAVIKDTKDIGFSAQEVRDFIPDAVVKFGSELPDGTGGQESDEPTLGIMTTTLLAALVNAVKELHAEIETLKGRSP